MLRWTPGVLQLADTLTKVLPKTQAQAIRQALGYLEVVPPRSGNGPNLSRDFGKFLTSSLSQLPCGLSGQGSIRCQEMCTATGSGFCHLDGVEVDGWTVHLLQVRKSDDFRKFSRTVSGSLDALSSEFGFPIVAFISPPCTGGSPLQYPRGDRDVIERRVAALFGVFQGLLNSALPLMKLGHARALELSRYCRFWRSKAVQDCMWRCDLGSASYWDRCAFLGSRPTARRLYRIQSTAGIRVGRMCTCKVHDPLSRQNVSELASYPRAMAQRLGRQLARQAVRSFGGR